MAKKTVPESAESVIAISKSASIVIVGGGPAGVHMAALLAKRGYSDITIIESEQEVGGKSHTIADEDGILHEMGTCYLHRLYGPIRDLIKEYDPDNKEIGLGGDDVRHAFGTGTRTGDDSNYLDGVDFGDYILQKAEEASAVPKSCWSCAPDCLQFVTLYSAIHRYAEIHESIFGKYEYGLPPRPKNWKLVDMTGHEFMVKNNLGALEGILRYAQQFQGYGVLEDIPAFYILWWMHPELLKSVISDSMESRHGVTMLVNGYQSMWVKMWQYHMNRREIKTMLNTRVTSVSRKDRQIKYVNNDTSKEGTIKFNHVIMAVNLNHYLDIIKDLTSAEKSLFSDYEEFVLATTLYEADPVDHEHPVEFWLSRMRPDEKRDGKGIEGRFHGHRNSRLALKGVDAPPVPRERRVAYQFLGRKRKDSDPEMLQKQLLVDLEKDGESNVKIIKHCPWPYMPQFSPKGLRDGKPWKILSAQGRNNTLWIGSSVCFESVLDCVAYNNTLVKRIMDQDTL